MGDAFGVVHELLQGGTSFRAPQTQRGNLLGLVDERHITQRELVAHALHPNIIPMPRITATNDPEAVLSKTDNRQVRVNTAGLIEKVSVNALANRSIGADFGHRAKLEQSLSISAHHIENGKVRQINHAHAITQGQVLRIGDLPKVSVIPFCSPRRHAIAIGLQQCGFIGSVAIGALPSGHFHKVSTQRHFALIKRACAHLPRRRVRLSRVDRRRIDFLRHFKTAVTNKFIGQLYGVMARRIDPMWVQFSAPLGHPIRQ